MNKLNILLLMSIATIVPQTAYSTNDCKDIPHEFAWQGIKYRVIDEEAKTCMTRPRIYTDGVGYDYTPFTDGSLTIPEEVYDGTAAYRVVEIGDSSFVDINNIHTVKLASTIESIGYAAFKSSDVQKIELPSSLKSVGNRAFQETNLTKVEFPSGITSIGAFSFYRSKLETADLSATSDALTRIDDYAFAVTDLSEISIPESCSEIGDGAFSACNNLKSITLPESLEYIAERLLSKCSSLESVVIPHNVKKIHQRAFDGCSRLEILEIPDNVEEISWRAFGSCSSLADVTLPASITYIAGSLFADCISLTNIVIPDGVTAIGSNAFENCSRLSSVKFPSSLQSIGEMAFYGCVLEGTIVFPESLKIIDDEFSEGGGMSDDELVHYGVFANNRLKRLEFPDNMEKIGRYSFDCCKELEYVKFPKWLETISEMSFHDCESLNEVLMPESPDIMIEEGAFFGCKSLISIEVPNGVKTIDTAVKYNPYKYVSYSGLSNLLTIVLPESIEALSSGVFAGKAMDVYYMTSTPREIKNLHENLNPAGIFRSETYQNGTLYVGKGGLKTAHATEPWKNFVDIREFELSEIKDVFADDLDSSIPTEVFDLHGRKVANDETELPAGIYVIKQGDNVHKILK